VSSLAFSALVLSTKNKILGRLMSVFTEELFQMMASAAYKALPPFEQMNVQSEVTHWYQRWFHLVPNPEVPSVEMDDYTEINEMNIPAALPVYHHDNLSWYYTVTGDQQMLNCTTYVERFPCQSPLPEEIPKNE
jgi:hypothetical protein